MKQIKLSVMVAIALSTILSSFISAPSKPLTVAIQPFGDIPPSYVSYVYKRLRKVIPNLSIANTAPLPPSAYYKARSRYRADSLVNILSRKTPAGNTTIGLTTADISCTSDPYPDWGVFGLSECPGKACVASSSRNKGNKAEGLFFTAIHELGHTQGIDHCPAPSCLMNDAKGHTIDATTFCPKCKAYLRAKGWTL